MSNILGQAVKDQPSSVRQDNANNNDTPQDDGARGNEDFTAVNSPPDTIPRTSGSCSVASDEKSFTTAYGMVVWPTLPGMSVTSTAAAPPVEPRAGAAGSKTGSLLDTADTKQQQQEKKQRKQRQQSKETEEQSQQPQEQPLHRPTKVSKNARRASVGDAWSQQRLQRGRARETSRTSVPNVSMSTRAYILLAYTRSDPKRGLLPLGMAANMATSYQNPLAAKLFERIPLSPAQHNSNVRQQEARSLSGDPCHVETTMDSRDIRCASTWAQCALVPSTTSYLDSCSKDRSSWQISVGHVGDDACLTRSGTPASSECRDRRRTGYPTSRSLLGCL